MAERPSDETLRRWIAEEPHLVQPSRYGGAMARELLLAREVIAAAEASLEAEDEFTWQQEELAVALRRYDEGSE